MRNKEEIKIFHMIKLMPTFVILISFISLYFLYENNQTHFNNEVDRLTKEALIEKEDLIKGEVLRVFDYIQTQKSLTKERMQANLKERVHEAHTIATSIYNNNRDKTDEQVQTLISEALRNVRFNDGRGYFFIYESNGINVMHPILPHLQQTNLWNFKDEKGLYVIREISAITKKHGEGAMTWWWKNALDTQTEYEKMGYAKHFDPFDWFIGTGDFVVDYEGQLKKELLSVINKIRYGKEGYIFVIDQNGTFLSHVKKSYIGSNRLDYKDARGVFVNKEILSIGKAGQGFLSYVGTIKPSTGEASRKRSFVIGVDDWQWVIGSGAYLDDIADIVARRTALLKEKNSKELMQHIVFALIFSFFLLIVSLSFSYILKKRFRRYQEKVHQKSIELNELNANLEVLVSSRTKALEVANVDLESTLSHLKSTQSKLLESEKMASMVGLVSGMAHEFNTPLGIMVTSISQLETEIEYLFGRLRSQKLTRQDLERVEQSWAIGYRLLDVNLQRSVHLVKSFKSLSIHNASDDLQTFPIKILIDSVRDDFVELFEKEGVKLTLKIEKDITLTSYQWVLGEVLSQLIKNSLTHGLTDIENPRVEVEVQENAGEVTIYYSDNGCGSEEVDKIFEPFYTTKRGSDCTGLGLPIIYNQVIHKLLGTITCTFNEEKGLAFIIKFPADLSSPIVTEQGKGSL